MTLARLTDDSFALGYELEIRGVLYRQTWRGPVNVPIARVRALAFTGNGELLLLGLSPETIAAECFPVLSLEQVYGAITYYLSHRQEIDAYLRQVNAEFEAFQQAHHDPEFSQKKAQARRQIHLAAP